MRKVRLLSLCGAALWLAACPGDSPETGEDAGMAPPDACNSLEEALTDPGCQLAFGEAREAFLSFADDRDWYSFQTPANADARTLIHISGGYAVPNTAVNFSVNLLRVDGQQSLARRSDRHGQGPPRPIDLVLPFAEPNARLVLLVADDPVNPSRPQFDARSPYRVTVDVVSDPDVNEPNDEVPTPIALTSMGGYQQGSAQGYLSTEGDVDRFSVEVPAGKKVLHLSLQAPAQTPPPPFRLSYELFSPSGTRVAEGVVQNEFLAVDLATARLSTEAGAWTVAVKGYESASLPGPKPGSLTLQYTLTARVLDEDDPSEGPGQNDTLATARALGFTAVGQTRTEQGKLGYVPDSDWFRVEVPAHASPTVLHYRLRPGQGPGRFAPLPGNLDRELRALREVVTGGSGADDVQACKTDQQRCPRAFGNDAVLSGIFTQQCEQPSPPRCLWARRAEHVSFDGLRNFEGTLRMDPAASARHVYLLVQDQGNDWADDVPYTLEVTWRADTDEANVWSGGPEQAPAKALAYDATGATYPSPPTGAAYEVTRRMSYGYGYLRSNNPNQGEGVRAPGDYDAVPSDVDTLRFTLPAAPDPDAGHADLAWALQWEIAHPADGGTRPYDLALELTFCDGDQSGGGGACTEVSTGSKGGAMTLQYTGSGVNAWHNPGSPAALRQPIYQREVQNGRTVVTVLPYGCFCLEPRFVRGGEFKVDVVSVDRRSHDDLPYTVRTAYLDYPQSYTLPDGGTESCPPPGPDAGCWFTREP